MANGSYANRESDDPYKNLRAQLHPRLAERSAEQIRTTLALEGMDADAMEGWLDDLGKFAQKAAPAILPIAGQVVGGIYGGPAGAAIGGSLGSLAGNAISGIGGGQRPAQPPAAPAAAPAFAAPSPMPPPAGPTAMGPTTGSPAAGQLLQSVLRPETLQALISMAMGASGKPNVSVGGTQVPVGAFGNMIGALAAQAEAEYERTMRIGASSTPEYLQDYAGESRVDEANAQSRAEALFGLLEASAPRSAPAESGDSESGESESELSEWEAEADAAEMLEVEYELSESEYA